MPTHTSIEPVRLGYVFLLERGAAPEATSIEGPARLAALRTNTYKPNYLAGLECVESHFRISCQVSAEVKMAILKLSKDVSNRTDLLASLCVELH